MLIAEKQSKVFDKMPITRMDSPTDPERCQGVVPSRGQCVNKRHEGSEYCLVHGGNKGAERAQKERLSNYRLAKWQARLEKQATSPAIKSLRDEVGILRMLMEETLDKCQTGFDLLVQSQKIGDLVMKITSVVEKCHKLEGSMGQLLDKKTVIQMANKFIHIISDEDLPEEVLDRIATRILEDIGGQSTEV